MTYCVGVKLEDGLIFASDSRTYAGVDNYAKFCKMTVFESAGDRVLVLLSSGGLAATQAVINVLRKRASVAPPHLWTVTSMFDVANLVADAMRDIERRDSPFLETGGLKFNASFILGGQIAGEEMRLFRIYARATSSRLAAIRTSCRPVKPSTANPFSTLL
jgi:putative proteasome-type protease